jgi:hypothetical protein
MVKLTERQLALFGEYPKESLLDSALALAKDGWHVFPLRPGTKIPLIGKKQGGSGAHDGTTDADTIRAWWKRWPSAGIGANLGDDRLAVDIDINHGGSRLASLPDTRTHISGRGNGNVHLIYRVEPGSAASAIRSGTHVLGPGIDIRSGFGSYIVMPPTPHEETGVAYSLDPVLRTEHTLTDEEVSAIYEEAGVSAPAASRGATRGLSVVQGGKSHKRPMESSNTTLAGLLADPPTEGGRNDWLSRVCGHYAKIHRSKEDLYWVEVREKATKIIPPLSDEEVEKTAQSIWDRETENHPERGLTEENGHLTGNRRVLFCQVARKEGDETVYDTYPYSDFDIEARGVAVDESSRRMYWVRLYWRGKTVETTLAGEVLGNENGFKAWLAARGMSVDPPFHASPKTAPATRVLRYLNSQDPAEVHIVTTLGYDEKSDSFVTHDGVITAEGRKSKEEAHVVANPALIERDVAPYVYGFEKDAAEARRVLGEVLSFQEEQTASIFGAWWAACLLKPQIQERLSIFPFFGIEAASESGKTNGFFDLMVALNGNTRGQVVPTRPVLRDLASANKNGIVWADDLDNLEPYGELLRASTSNGTASKMEADRSGIRNTQVVAPILISGEALGFESQKALVDRSVVLTINSPKGRKSRHDKKRPQWDDVVALKRQYPESVGGLSSLSGHFVQQAMAEQRVAMKALSAEGRKASGRHGDKLAVLRAGAMLLDSLLGTPGAWEGQGEHYLRVDAWCIKNNQVLDQDNALTIKVLPWALQTFDFPDEPELVTEGRLSGLKSPVFVEGDLEANQTSLPGVGEEARTRIWYSPSLLAEAWQRSRNGRVDARTESLTALDQQSQALRGESRQFRVQGSRANLRYRRLPDEYVAVVIQRASR